MAEAIPLAPVMHANQIRHVLHPPENNAEFEHTIVYLPRYNRHDGGFTNDNGLFQDFLLNVTMWSTPIDDWHLDVDAYPNDHGSAVKSVYVTYDFEEYYEAFLYCRVRTSTAYIHIHNVLEQLNKHLDNYV